MKKLTAFVLVADVVRRDGLMFPEKVIREMAQKHGWELQRNEDGKLVAIASIPVDDETARKMRQEQAVMLGFEIKDEERREK